MPMVIKYYGDKKVFIREEDWPSRKNNKTLCLMCLENKSRYVLVGEQVSKMTPCIFIQIEELKDDDGKRESSIS